MLRAVVETFLDSLTEREFDGPLLALLTAQGCTNIAFLHGGFEFGKDVIAQRTDPDTGITYQLAIQSKAGDLNQRAWRDVRPQLEECEYNTRAHPTYDATLPRIAVLVTTGRLIGGAAIDAQEYKATCTSRGLADLEVWDRGTIASWLAADPDLGFSGTALDADLLTITSTAMNQAITEPAIERHTRRWLDEQVALPQACLHTAVLCHTLRTAKRLDLAALTALHLLRAAAASPADTPQRGAVAANAIRLFRAYAIDVLDALEPLLNDPNDLVAPLASLAVAATYPAMCLRLIEITSALALTGEGLDDGVTYRARQATATLASRHPGAARPPSDAYAVSVVAAVTVLATDDPACARAYLRAVAEWMLDRHDPDKSGLGLASLQETPDVTVERLVGGALSITTLEPRRSSHLLAAVLDSLIMLGFDDLYNSVLSNGLALGMIASMSYADETKASWRRSGPDVWPQPNIEYLPAGQPPPPHHGFVNAVMLKEGASWATAAPLLLSLVSRSRHDLTVLSDAILSPDNDVIAYSKRTLSRPR